MPDFILPVALFAASAILIIFRKRRKLTFDKAVLKASHHYFVLDLNWRHDPNTEVNARVYNGALSVIYTRITIDGQVIEHIDMASPTSPGGGLNVTFCDGEPTHWGRFGDQLNLPGIRPEDAIKAKSILKAVKQAI